MPNRQSNQGYTNPPPPHQNTSRCLPIGFSLRSLLFGDRSSGSRESSSISITRKKDGNNGGRKGDRDDSNASGSSSSQRTGRGSHDNTNAGATTSFVDRDRVIPLNADGTRSRGSPDSSPYGLPSRNTTTNHNTNTTNSGGGNVGGMQGSHRSDKEGNVIASSGNHTSSMLQQHAQNHTHQPINQMSPTPVLLPIPPYDPTANITVDGSNNHNNNQGRKPSPQPEETAGWYSLGYAIERLAFPLTSSASGQSSSGIINLNSSNSTSISVQQVHVDDADESSDDDDQDFDADGDGNPSPMDLNQLHNHSHSPGLFLDHSLSHPLTLGLGGVWTNPLASSSSSSTTQLRQQRILSPSSSSRREHDTCGMGQLDLEDALSPRSEEGMVQALAMTASGRQNNNGTSNGNYNGGGGGGGGGGTGLQPFSPGGQFYNGPGMASPHVASASNINQQYHRGMNMPMNASTTSAAPGVVANRPTNNYNSGNAMQEDNNSYDQSGCVIS